MSVALSANPPASARSRTLERIGIVVRRSTTLWTWLSAFRRAARSTVSFMLLHDYFWRTGREAPVRCAGPLGCVSKRDGIIARNRRRHTRVGSDAFFRDWEERSDEAISIGSVVGPTR